MKRDTVFKNIIKIIRELDYKDIELVFLFAARLAEIRGIATIKAE